MLRNNLKLSFLIFTFITFSILEISVFPSSISITLGSYEPEGAFSIANNVYLVLVDPLSREIGYNPFTKEWKEDIPEAGIGSDSVPDLESGSPEPAEFGVDIISNNIPVGEYKIKIYGLKDVKYFLEGPFPYYVGYISSETTSVVSFNYDPTPGAPPPVLTKVVTFKTLKEDIEVAYKLNQIGDDKFIRSLIKMVDIAEKLSQRCEKTEYKDQKIKSKCYRPVVAILRMMMKRLEVINKLCDNKTECKPRCKVKTECDEDEVFKGFENKYGKDNDFKDFFLEWERDEYQIHKKSCKKYLTDEALEIITTDINWLIKGFGEDIWSDYKKEHEPYIADKYKSFF